MDIKRHFEIYGAEKPACCNFSTFVETNPFGMPAPYKLFTIYAREDSAYLKELRGQLRPLEIAGRIKVWSDNEINPGVDWEKEIVHQLDTADIILILVSAAYYDSAYIHEKEIKYAIKRHELGVAKVLPVIVRPCAWLDDPVISRLQALPEDGTPVTDKRRWSERDEAWLDVVNGIKTALKEMDDAFTQAAEQARLAAEKKELEALEAIREVQRKKEAIQREESERQELLHRQALAAEQQRKLEQERMEREKLRQQKQAELDAFNKADQEAWQNAEAQDDQGAYALYLQSFPMGAWAEEAERRIRKIAFSQKPFLARYKYPLIAATLVIFLFIWLGPLNRVGSAKEAKLSGAMQADPTGESFKINEPSSQAVQDVTTKVLPPDGKTQPVQNKNSEPVNKKNKSESAPLQLKEPAFSEEKVYEMFDVQTPPKFPGGEAAMADFIQKNLIYPLLAKENNIQGAVVVTFVVDKAGNLLHVRLVKDIGGGCGKEALRLIALMPKWKPGEVNGGLANVKYTLPIRFRLS